MTQLSTVTVTAKGSRTGLETRVYAKKIYPGAKSAITISRHQRRSMVHGCKDSHPIILEPDGYGPWRAKDNGSYISYERVDG